MSNLVIEVLLRLIKPAAALVLGLVIWFVATGLLGAAGSVELALLSWIAGGIFISLVESGPL